MHTLTRVTLAWVVLFLWSGSSSVRAPGLEITDRSAPARRCVSSACPPPQTVYLPLVVQSETSAWEVPVQAIQVADDDGGRVTPITPGQVSQWVDKTNAIYAAANIHFAFDPDRDFAPLASTLLNNMTGMADPNWLAEISFGDEVAARYPGKLVIYFRYGPGASPSGGAFSWYDYNFVAAPGFDVTSVCGYQNIGLIAHEIGHYLGLPHTFAGIFSSVAEAEAVLTSSGNNPQVFDGDGFSDTPPDPYVAAYTLQCTPVETLTLNGLVLPLPRTNIMSYYEVRTGLSPQQIERAGWLLARRMSHGMAMPTNSAASGALEVESLLRTSSGASCGTQDMSPWGAHQWSGGQHLFCSAAQAGAVTLILPEVSQPGRYQLTLYATLAPDFGQIQVALDGQCVRPALDLYAPVVAPSGPLALGSVELGAGTHQVQISVIGKAGASTNYYLGLDALTLVAEP